MPLRSILFFTAAVLFLTIGLGASAQSDRRDRVAPSPTPTPTPRVPVSTTPSATPVPTPTPVIQTLPELQSRIRATLGRPELRRGSIGIKILSLASNKVIFEENAEKYFMPASNMKNFTVATGFERLTPDFKFVTSVYAPGGVDGAGMIRGPLSIFGRGDVSISTAFNNGDYYKGLEALADKIMQAGVKRIEGDIIADDSYFSGSAIPYGWEWDDLQSYYGAEVSALPVNDNAVDFTVRPGSVGSQCIAQVQPINVVVKIINTCVTTRSGPSTLRVQKKLGQNVIEVSGNLPIGNAGFTNYIAVTRPAELFAELLRQVLIKRGVTVTGQSRLVSPQAVAAIPTDPSAPQRVEIARLESAPYSIIAAKTMKPSQNMYTETILWALGEQVGDKSTFRTSAQRGTAVVSSFLKQIGIPEGSVLQYDGSGLSRHNLVTPNAVATLYAYMAKSRYALSWRESLTIGGVDGTLRNRFKGTAAAGNMRGKTGTIDQVSALSGYVTTAAGEQLVVSIIVNGVPEPSARTSIADSIVVNLANFNGKID